jgi:FkbM family methyltransferase
MWVWVQRELPIYMKNLKVIDPLDEAETFFKNNMANKGAVFFKTALGEKEDNVMINVEDSRGRSTILDVADINYEGDPIEKRNVTVRKLDNVVRKSQLGRVGLKIDTEGYELNVIRGAKEVLKITKFVLAEVRHNHESFHGVYKLHEFVKEMHENGFVLSKILTAKPFIADLCFEPIKELML